MATLDHDFGSKATDAILEAVEHKLVGEQGNVIARFEQQVRERLERYGDRLDYNVEPIIDSFEFEGVRRVGRTLYIRFGWTHEAALYMEFGTSDHTVEGDPLLSFIWEDRHDPPEWVAEDYEREGDGYRVFLPEVEVSGVEKIRQVRSALMWLRGELS